MFPTDDRHVSAEPVHAGTTIYQGAGGGVFNSATNGGSTITVVCPIQLDVNFVNNYPDDVEISVQDEHSSQNITCYFTYYWISEDGATTDYETDPETSAGDSDDWQVLSWNFTNSALVSGQGTMWGVYCIIPPKDASGNKSGIGQYTVFQRDS